MRPAHVYAKLSDADYDEPISALHRWRTPTRAVMVLLSAGGMNATDIAALLHYSPKTVRYWIGRHQAEGLAGLPDRPRCGRPRRGSPNLGARITDLLATPRAWTVARIWRALGCPAISVHTCYRRIREQARWCRPRLVAKGDHDHDTICHHIRDQVCGCRNPHPPWPQPSSAIEGILLRG